MTIRLLDLFCGAGGAAMGYHRAGFDEIVGVDIKPQKRYPFTFVEGDALAYVAEHGHEFHAIHASPPCQAYSKTRGLQGNNHPKLVGPTRGQLRATGKPWVIENVQGAPLIDPIVLTGTMFDLLVVRPRLFESSVPLPQPEIPDMPTPHAKMGRPPSEGEYIHVVGNFSGADYARQAMGIDWMVKSELAQAIPPAYTEFIGSHLLEHIRERA